MVTNPATLSKSEKMQVQRELQAAGFYHGAIDGIWGPLSTGAWIASQASRAGHIIPEKHLTAEVRTEFESLYAAAITRPEHRAEVAAIADRIVANRQIYEGVAATTGVPWWFIGLIHAMECSLNFHQHLHNGDPLTHRTVHVPAGRPKSGQPPFDWAYSAADALLCDDLTEWKDWSLAGSLHRLESFNGFGYREREMPTPYLWSYTTIYTSGKYVADGVYSPSAVSDQAGCAAILKALMECGAVQF